MKIQNAMKILTVIFLLLVAALATAETTEATGSGLQWTVVIPDGATGVAVTAACWDCDVSDEATVAVNGGPTTLLFGSDDASRDGRVAQVPLPVTLAPGANTLTFVCLRRANCIRVDGIVATYAMPVTDPLRSWLEAAPALEVWAVSREDTEPGRVLVCGRDAAGQYAVALPADIGALPVAPAPATACDAAWCFASGPGRAAAVREACL